LISDLLMVVHFGAGRKLTRKDQFMKVQKCALVIALGAAVLLPQICHAAGGGATPQATFDNFRNAMKSKDYKASYSQMTPETQDMMLGGMAVAMSMGLGMDPAKAADAQKVTEKHGVKKMDPTKLQPGQDPKALVRETVAEVKDKPGCFADMMTWMETNVPNKDKDAKMEEYNSATLSDVKIEGDTATGNVKVKHEGQDTSSPMNFKKIGAVWFIDMGGGATAAPKSAAPAAPAAK
jgi:hypothetical protein